MKKISLVILVLFMCYAVKAQDNLPAFGKIDIADLQLKECDFDKSADAMNLIKTKKVRFDVDNMGNAKTYTEYRIRIKIFKESGFKNASIVIPFAGNSRSTKITDLEGYIYNLTDSGTIDAQKLNKDQVFKEKSKSKKSYNDIRFTFPGLKAGSVIEYKYMRIDKDGVYLPPWFFQEELPVQYSRCTVTIPSYMRMEFHVVAAMPVEKDSLLKTYASSFGDEDIRGFTMRNVPAFRFEPFMSSLRDNLQRVEFSAKPKRSSFGGGIFSPWQVYNLSLLISPYFGMQFDEDIAGTKPFLDSVKLMKEKGDKINALYSYVKKNVAWNGERSIYSDGLTDCWKEKTGNTAEINLLLLNFLKKAGINCYPILISTRENGKLDQTFPSLGQFNGVDVLVLEDSAVYVIDCTQKNLSIKTTPYNVLNSDAFIIDSKYSKWVNLTDSRPLMNTQTYINAMLDDSTGMLRGSGQVIYTGIAKAQILAEEESEEKEKKNSKGFINNDAADGNDITDLKIDSVSAVHNNDDNDSLIHKITFHSTLSNTGDIYFVNPFMFSMFKKKPFRDSARFTDIDFGASQSYATQLRVFVPPGFTIEETPKSVSIRTQDSSIMFRREIFSAGNQILVRNSFNINRAVFDKEEYKGLKTFFDKVYALINEQVVLKKAEQ